MDQTEAVTDRQRQVLDLLAKGLTVREVAIKLGITTQAVYRLRTRAGFEEASA